MPNSTIRPGSEEEWDALMHQLRRQPKPQPRPFFYARVRARLTTPRPWLPGWGRLPAYLALLGLLMLAVRGDGTALSTATTAGHYNAPPYGQPSVSLPH